MHGWTDRLSTFAKSCLPGSKACTPKPDSPQQGLCEEASCLQKACRPGLWQVVPGRPEAAQHVGHIYSHLPHTEPCYPKQNERNKNKELVHSAGRRGVPAGRKRGYMGGQRAHSALQPVRKAPGTYMWLQSTGGCPQVN